jgi:hypothetical protein
VRVGAETFQEHGLTVPIGTYRVKGFVE